MLHLFKGTCEAVQAMHDYRAPLATRSNPQPSRGNRSAAASSSIPRPPSRNISADNGHSDDEDDEMFPHPEGDSEGGYSYHGPPGHSQSVPLVTKKATVDDSENVFDGDDELANIQANGLSNGAATGETELVPYAHRDLKPGYVLYLLAILSTSL